MLQKNFDILATKSVLHNYFNSSTKFTFLICIPLKFSNFQ